MEDQTDSSSKIINAAYTLFQKKGIDSTSTKEIAKVAKVNEVTIFRLFKNKKNLATKVVEIHGPASVVDKFEKLELSEDQEENLLALTMTLIKFHSDNKAFMKFIFHNLTTKKSLPHLTKMLDPLLNWLEEYLAKFTSLTPADRRKFATEFSSVVAMRSIRKAITDSAEPFAEIDSDFAKFHARIFAGALRDLTETKKGKA